MQQKVYLAVPYLGPSVKPPFRQTDPTRGQVTVNGRVSALLELGAGFNPEFSGRDNVYLNGSILGLSTREIDRRYGESKPSPKSATSSTGR